MKLLMENWQEFLKEDVATAQQYPILFSLSHGNKARAMQLAAAQGIKLPDKLADRVIEYANRSALQKTIASGQYQKQMKKYISQGGYRTFAHGPDSGVTINLKDEQTKEKNKHKLNIAATFYVWALENGLRPTQPYLEYDDKQNLTYMRVDLE